MTTDLRVVLDSSALLAFLQAEPGGTSVESELQTAVISSVNWAEVVQKALERQVEVAGLREELEALGLQIAPFTPSQAEKVAHLREPTRHLGLSLGDRACLALAAELELPAWTTDRIWSQISQGVEIKLLR